jgi:hypothetical protein
VDVGGFKPSAYILTACSSHIWVLSRSFSYLDTACLSLICDREARWEKVERPWDQEDREKEAQPLECRNREPNTTLVRFPFTNPVMGIRAS